MKRTLPFLIALFFTVLPQPSYSEKTEEDPFWITEFFEKGGISPIADEIRKKKIWGFIDKSGRYVVSPKYDKVEYFSKGITLALKGNTAFIIDKSGKVLETYPSVMDVLNKRSAENAKEYQKEILEKDSRLYKGDIYNSDGTVFFATSKDVTLNQFSEDLAACELPESVIKRFGSQLKSRAEYGELDVIAEKLLNRWGYINAQGRMIIAPRFHSAGEFKNGIASVSRWFLHESPYEPQLGGYIDKSGKIIGGKYHQENNGEIKEGLLPIRVKVEGKFRGNEGFMYPNGFKIMGPWIETYSFTRGFAPVKTRDGKWGFINKFGDMIESPKYSNVAYEAAEGLRWVKTDTGYGFVDLGLNMKIPPKFSDAESFFEGLAAVAIDISDTEKLNFIEKESDFLFGFVDLNDKEIIKAKYNGARRFSENLAPVMEGLNWGFINKTGQMVIKPQFDDAFPFREGMAAVKKNGYWGFIDKTGKYAIKPRFITSSSYANTKPHDFQEGISIAPDTDQQFICINKNGEIAFNLPSVISSFSDVRNADFSQGLAAWPHTDEGNQKFGFIDKTGKYALPPKLETAEPFSEGRAAVSLIFDSPSQSTIKTIFEHNVPKWRHDLPQEVKGYIDLNGNFYSCKKYDEISSFHEGLAKVSKCLSMPQGKGGPYIRQMTLRGPRYDVQKDLCGFIDKNGNEIIKLQFEEAGDFSEGVAAIRRGQKFGFINKVGKIVVEPKVDFVGPFKSGRATCQQGDQFGYINKMGTFISKPSHLMADSFYDDRAIIVKSKRIKPGERVRSWSNTIMFLVEHGMGRWQNWSGTEERY
jgi:hypothetical protein